MTSKIYITWEEFHNDTNTLYKMITDKYNKDDFKGIIAVARGGYIPATIIAHTMWIKNVRSISLSTYNEDNIMNDVTVNNIFKDDDKWLIIDELADTGSTFNKIRKYLPNSVYAVVYSKPNGLQLTDYYGKKIPQDEWIVFPWE